MKNRFTCCWKDLNIIPRWIKLGRLKHGTTQITGRNHVYMVIKDGDKIFAHKRLRYSSYSRKKRK